MAVGETHETYGNLSQAAKPAILAMSVLLDRLRSLPEADRSDFFELLNEFRVPKDQEDQESLIRAMEEILAQAPIRSKSMTLGTDQPVAAGWTAWSEAVGRRIRTHREAAGLTQVELASKAGLPQSHISRLENAAHSETNLTLEKIAKALDIPLTALDLGVI